MESGPDELSDYLVLTGLVFGTTGCLGRRTESLRLSVVFALGTVAGRT